MTKKIANISMSSSYFKRFSNAFSWQLGVCGGACALVVASLLYSLVACVLGVACVLVVAFLPSEEVCHRWK